MMYRFFLLALLLNVLARYEANEAGTSVKMNIPHILRFFPELGKLFGEREAKESDFELEQRHQQTLANYLSRAREEYQKIRESIQFLLHMNSNKDSPFSLDLDHTGPKTKLNVETPFGQVSVNTRKDPSDVSEEDSTETSEASTEIPFRYYLKHLVKEQAATVFPATLESTTKIEESSNEETEVTTEAYRTDYSSRKGDSGLESRFEEGPVEEYNKFLEEQTRKFLEMRGLSQEHFYSTHVLDKLLKPLTESPEDSDTSTDGSDRKSLWNSFYGFRKNSDETSYESYVSNLETEIGPLAPEARGKLKLAFGQLKKALDEINFGNDFDVNSLFYSNSRHGRDCVSEAIDQRDMEITYLNSHSSSPTDMRTVLAFTLTGIPLKIYLNPLIENPIAFLHATLSSAGITLNVPVLSKDLHQPIDNEIVVIGAGKRNPSATLSLRITDIEQMKTNIEKLVKPRSSFTPV